MLLNRGIPFGYIVNKVKHEMVHVLLVSLTVLFLTERYKQFLPEMPLAIPTFIGTAISILLSFKLNQSYDRWWEARKIWGAIVNDSRSFVIQLKTLTEAEMESIRTLAYRQIAWCYSLSQSLRGLNPLENLDQHLSKEDISYISTHNNKPLALLDLNGRDLQKMRRNNQVYLFAQVQIDDTLVRLCDSQGKAERIKSTVFPKTYRLFLHFIIYLFVITLSIALKDVAGYFEIPLLLLISAAFFLLEKSAVHMQDPFENLPTDTAMTAISRTIEINIKQLLNETEIPSPHPPNKFYLT